MTGSRFLWLACLLACITVTPHAEQHSGVNLVVSLTPAMVEAGSPELIVVSAPKAQNVSGEWLGRKLEFFHRGANWIALAGVDVEGAAGPSRLEISAQLDNSGPLDLSQTVNIYPGHYRTGALVVPPKFVEPGPEEQKIIAADADLKAKVFASSASEPLWHGNFRAPVLAEPTDSFGTRRMFNGKLASVHKGMDFRAAKGTVVRASNSGIVVLARPLYYEGNCVVIDHGLGLYTVSMHFSRVDVHEGQHVVAGESSDSAAQRGALQDLICIGPSAGKARISIRLSYCG